MAGAAVLALLFLFPSLTEDFELQLIDSRFETRQVLGLAPTFSDRIAHVNIDNYSKTESTLERREKVGHLIKFAMNSVLGRKI